VEGVERLRRREGEGRARKKGSCTTAVRKEKKSFTTAVIAYRKEAYRKEESLERALVEP